MTARESREHHRDLHHMTPHAKAQPHVQPYRPQFWFIWFIWLVAVMVDVGHQLRVIGLLARLLGRLLRRLA